MSCSPPAEVNEGEAAGESETSNQLSVLENGRFFAQNEEPFLWLGDTGWLLFSKLNRKEAETYASWPDFNMFHSGHRCMRAKKSGPAGIIPVTEAKRK